MIKAVIFDMDGVIIDSEPFWREAEMETFTQLGIKMTNEMCLQMKGVKIDEVVRHWYSVYKWKNKSLVDVEKSIVDKFISLVHEKGVPMSGLMGLLEYLRSSNIKIGLATSSNFLIMNAILDKLRLHDYFDVKHSAEAEKAGKPAPDVFLSTAKQLDVKPDECVVVEDSYNGLLAAKAAGMYAIVIPEAPEFNLEKYNIANKKIKSLKEIIYLGLFNEIKAVS